MSTTVDNNLSNSETIDFGQVPTTVPGRIFMGRQTDLADNGTNDDIDEVDLVDRIRIRDLFDAGLEPFHQCHPHSKPSNTVTKEEIESSGMEVITTQQLEQYAKVGKVTNTACTEQCIICLEEYKGEDEVCVTKCKHAFHRRCIDNWMETGKNNCPACRSECIKRSKEAEAGAV